MKKFAALLFGCFMVLLAHSQNSFVFSCTRDTTLTCSNNCITLRAVVPNIKDYSGTYKVVKTSGPGGCFVPPVAPDLPGLPTNLSQDDRYTTLIGLPFMFPFYGAAYTDAVVSTNGVICFDATKATSFAHYGIIQSGTGLGASTGTPADLPNSRYDRAVIMGLYADIDPTVTTSPNQQIKYEVVGNAPHRKWIVSFYKVPCFQTSCNNLIENSYQMVLYEGLGVIDVFVYSREICTAWNQGRAMIGIQNYDRTDGLMPPGRAASSPLWGGTNMNESWRFIPSGGLPMIKRVQLYDLAGNLVATGDTSSLADGNLQVLFPNVCTNTSTTYIVKSTYGAWDNPNQDIFGTDTVRINNTSVAAPINEAITPAPCGTNTTGTITIASPVGATIQYTVTNSGGVSITQSSPVFTLSPGVYTIKATDTNTGCESIKTVTINTQSTLSATAVADSAACPGSATGALTITGLQGTSPYTYSVDGSPFQNSNNFGGLLSGPHEITIKDNLGCTFTFNADIYNRNGFTASGSSTLTTCNGAANGSITITPNSGSAPYTFTLGGVVQNTGTFGGLSSGSYSVLVQDHNGCSTTVNQSVTDGVGFTTTASTTASACATAHTGSITIALPGNNAAPYTYKLDTSAAAVFQNSNQFSNLLPGTYNLVVRDGNGCQYAFQATVTAGAGSNATAGTFNAACTGSPTGTIYFTPTQGTAPFQYSIDNGANYVVTDTFRNLLSGPYNLSVKDANGCVFNFTTTLNSNPGVTATSTVVKTACAAASTGSITVIPANGTAPYRYSLDGGAHFQNNPTFNNLAQNSYTVLVKDANGCEFSLPVTVGAEVGVTATASSTNTACAVAATGTITVTPNLGTAPFEFSLDNGTNYQNSSSFSNLPSGPYTVTVRDFNGCTVTVTATVGADVGVTATAQTTNSACATANTGTITVTPNLGTAPFEYSIDNGTNYQSNSSFGNLLPGTYAITIRDFNGCSTTVNATVGNDIGVTATSQTTNSACATANTGTITVNPNLGTAPFEYSIDNGAHYQTGATFSSLLPGTYTITIRDFNGCTATINATVGSDIGVTATTSSTNSACASANTGTITVAPVLGTAPFEYSIDNGAHYQNTATFTNLLPGPYTITVRDLNGCSLNVSQTVGNDIGVTATTSTVNAACSGSPTGKVIIHPNLGTAPFEFSIDNGVHYQLNDTFPGLNGGNYTVLIRDANGCTATVTATVSNSIGTTATARTVNSACAAASTGKIIVTPVLGTAPFRYSLDNVNYQSSDTFSLLAAGPYTVYVQDVYGCTFSLPVTVGNDPGSRATARTLNAACTGAATGTIIVTPTLGTAPFTYLIDTSTVNQFQSSAIFRNMLSGIYDLTVRDANGCDFNLNATVNNNVGVLADTIIDKASCAIVPNGKITVIPTAGIAPFSYALNGGTPQSSNEFGQLFSGNFTVTVTDSARCQLVLNVTVGNAARVVIDSVNIVRPTCNGLTNATISIYPRLGVPPYRYSINSSAWQTSNIFRNRGASASDTIRIMDNSGCVKDTIITVTEPAALSMSTASVAATCTGNSDGSIAVTALGGTLPYQYTLDPAGLIAYQSNPVFPLKIGSYTVTTRDANGCKVSGNEAVILNDTMRLELGPDTTLCIGKSITFNTQTNNETTVFHWTPSSFLNDSLFKNPTASPADTIKYYLEARWGICTRRDSITVNVLLKPTAFAGNDTAVCFQTPAFLHGSSGRVSGNVTYTWRPSLFLNRTDTTDVISRPDTTGRFRYFLTVKDDYGCGFTSTDSVLVTMQPLVPAFAGNDTNAVQGQPHQLHATGGVQYSWWPIGPLNNPYIANPLATIQQNTYFVVTVTDVAGCVGSDTVLLRAYRGPTYHCPNAFSPNGDGNNDRFRALPVGIRSTYYFRIFNRYGELVFETNTWEGQFLKGWDGTYRGKAQDPGAYVWSVKGIDENGREVLMSGTVMLVR